MKTIKQIDPWTGCGLAAFATAYDKFNDYIESLKWFKRNKLLESNHFVTVPSMMEAIRRVFGILPVQKYSLDTENSLVLCFGRYDGKDKYRHWFVYHNGCYYDPCPYIDSPKKVNKT